MSRRRRILVHLVRDILKDAVPSANGRVFNQAQIPVNPKDIPCILVSRGAEQVSRHDASPPSNKRVLTIEISPIVKGSAGDMEDSLSLLMDDIEEAMQELQFVASTDPEDSDYLLIDDFQQTHVTGSQSFSDGERAYTGCSLMYEATYITDEGSRGEAGPGVPASNVRTLFTKAVTQWEPVATDEINFQEKSCL